MKKEFKRYDYAKKFYDKKVKEPNAYGVFLDTFDEDGDLI